MKNFPTMITVVYVVLEKAASVPANHSYYSTICDIYLTIQYDMIRKNIDTYLNYDTIGL